MPCPAISLTTATVGRHRRPQKRLQAARQPPVYLNSSPDHRACNSLTPLRCHRAVHPCPSVDSGLSNNTWPNLSEGERLSSMEERMKFVAKLRADGHRDGTKWYEQQLRQHWLILNKWAHANYVSHRVSRRLGARGMESRLLGPSFSGLDTPLILLMSSLQDIMEDFINLCGRSTKLDGVSLREGFDSAHTKLWESIKKVDPDLRSRDFQLVYVVKEEDAIPWGGNEEVEEREDSFFRKLGWAVSCSWNDLRSWKSRGK